jgi:hypothetical protein
MFIRYIAVQIGERFLQNKKAIRYITAFRCIHKKLHDYANRLGWRGPFSSISINGG